MPKKTEVKCDGMMLTAGFHAASPPLIWRFDLERNHSFTLALQGEEGDWDLGLTSTKGEFHSIVHFLAREDAEEAFAQIEKVISRSHRNGASHSVLKAVLIVSVLAILIFLGIGLFTRYVEHRSDASSFLMQPSALSLDSIPVTSNPNPISSRIMPLPTQKPHQDGVPQSADDILQPPP